MENIEYFNQHPDKTLGLANESKFTFIREVNTNQVLEKQFININSKFGNLVSVFLNYVEDGFYFQIQRKIRHDFINCNQLQ